MLEYTPFVKFPDDSASFVHGYEAGQIGAMMDEGRIGISQRPVHTANIEVLIRMSDAYGYEHELRETEYPEWHYFRAQKGAPALAGIDRRPRHSKSG